MFRKLLLTCAFLLLSVTSASANVMQPFAAHTTLAQDCRTFKETGKTVCGQFLTYWNTRGGLAQQGFPLSDEMVEVSNTDGKPYTVQYFERAVFELHPELTTTNKVLLQLLGVFQYQHKYPNGATGQQANDQPGSVFYSQTGHRLGGKFKTYWDSHGGLAQQGYPISDEFTEVSFLDGKPYKVQYFERAVFEEHTENQPPYNVLLSQLGKFFYDLNYTPEGPAPPGHTDVDGRVEPRCGTPNTTFRFYGSGFYPQEPLDVWLTRPDGLVETTAPPTILTTISGEFSYDLPTDSGWPLGWWAMTWKGGYSGHRSIGYFQVVSDLAKCNAGSNPPNHEQQFGR